METNRLKLHERLKELGANVYYQPPSSKKIEYPAIIYSRSSIETMYANDSVYGHNYSYEVILVEEDIDSEIAQQILNMPKCRFNRHYVADNLNHTVFTIYC